MAQVIIYRRTFLQCARAISLEHDSISYKYIARVV